MKRIFILWNKKKNNHDHNKTRENFFLGCRAGGALNRKVEYFWTTLNHLIFSFDSILYSGFLYFLTHDRSSWRHKKASVLFIRCHDSQNQLWHFISVSCPVFCPLVFVQQHTLRTNSVTIKSSVTFYAWQEKFAHVTSIISFHHFREFPFGFRSLWINFPSIYFE